MLSLGLSFNFFTIIFDQNVIRSHKYIVFEQMRLYTIIKTIKSGMDIRPFLNYLTENPLVYHFNLFNVNKIMQNLRNNGKSPDVFNFKYFLLFYCNLLFSDTFL